MLAFIAIFAAMLAYVPFGLAVIVIEKKLLRRANTAKKRKVAGGIIIALSLIGIIAGIMVFRGVMADYL